MITLVSKRAHGLRLMPDGLWRRLIAAVLAHAVAAQALIVALGGFSLTANADQSPLAFELCSHDVNGATQSPARLPDHSECALCIFCFAGMHHAMICTTSSAFHRVNIAMVVVLWHGDTPGLRRVIRHTIASPRGPPPGA
jgi:hypothetical protein